MWRGHALKTDGCVRNSLATSIYSKATAAVRASPLLMLRPIAAHVLRVTLVCAVPTSSLNLGQPAQSFQCQGAIAATLLSALLAARRDGQCPPSLSGGPGRPRHFPTFPGLPLAILPAQLQPPHLAHSKNFPASSEHMLS